MLLVSLEPLARFVTGGAEARPDHSITRHTPTRLATDDLGEMSNRTGEPVARPVQPTKDTLNALQLLADEVIE